MTGAPHVDSGSDLLSASTAEILHGFLSFWDRPTRVQLGLWLVATAQIRQSLPAVLAEWLRCADFKPRPRDIVALAAAMENPRSMQAIILRAALDHNIPVDDITGDDRTQAISEIRQKVMSDMRAAGYTYVQIGRVLQRDTSTVQHGVAAHAKRARADSRNPRSGNDLH